MRLQLPKQRYVTLHRLILVGRLLFQLSYSSGSLTLEEVECSTDLTQFACDTNVGHPVQVSL